MMRLNIKELNATYCASSAQGPRHPKLGFLYVRDEVWTPPNTIATEGWMTLSFGPNDQRMAVRTCPALRAARSIKLPTILAWSASSETGYLADHILDEMKKAVPSRTSPDLPARARL
jgi:hypothetical protein